MEMKMKVNSASAPRAVTRGMACGMSRRARRALFGSGSPKSKHQEEQRQQQRQHGAERRRDRPAAAAEPALELVPIPVLASPRCDESPLYCVLQWSAAASREQHHH